MVCLLLITTSHNILDCLEHLLLGDNSARIGCNPRWLASQCGRSQSDGYRDTMLHATRCYPGVIPRTDALL